MDMLYSVLTDDEMAALSDSHAATAAASAWKRIVTSAARGRDHHQGANRQPKDDVSSGSDGARVYPILGLLEAADPGVDKPERVAAGGVGKSRAATGGLRRHRSWQPALDTIEEVPFHDAAAG
jgi:hypothetical protein